jgi:hypothetical protein
MEKDYNYVYITTHIITKKQYVGSHSTYNIDDNYLGSGRYFLRAIKKEGKEKFKREILEECSNILEARELEGFYIEKYNTLYPNGYNLSPKGGIGFKGATHSILTKEKQSIWQKGKTFIELYGEEKAMKMKEKQRQKKIGTTTKRKGKGHKQELIEIYGEIDGILRYEEFVKKQREQKLGKKQSIETIEKRMKSLGDPWNKGKTYTNHPRTKEQIDYMSSQMKLSFYTRLDLNKLIMIKESYHKNESYSEMTKKTGYAINKLKRIIKEKLWEISANSL